MIQPVQRNTHPTRLQQAANALRIQIHQERQAIAAAADPAEVLKRVDNLADAMITLASMVECLAFHAGHGR